MTDVPDTQPITADLSREELIRLLRDDPRTVSRAAIKAAFADGRLGDQDLDIPYLAGMKRIQDLLADLKPTDSKARSSSPRASRKVAATTPAPGTGSERPIAAAGRLTDLEDRVGRLEAHVDELPPPVDLAPVTNDLTELRASLARADEELIRQAKEIRRQGLALAFVLILAVVAVVLALVPR